MTKPSTNSSQPYPPISDYALLSDCQCTALVSRSGSIDWCCMPRMDADSCFGRILDWELGGFCAITPTGEYRASRWYEDGTLILVNHFETDQGEVRLYDFFTVSNSLKEPSFYQLVRIVEGVTGEVELAIQVSPRFDCGEIAPYLRQHGEDTYTAWASNMGFVIHFDRPLKVIEKRDLKGRFKVRPGERVHFSLRFDYPEHLQAAVSEQLDFPQCLDQQLEDCRRWWRDWSGRMSPAFARDPYTLRSALVLKGLTFERTGAIIAAATTSLPEWIGTERNWDYRFSWIRDSVFAVRILHELGYPREAERFGDFIERSSAGSADELQVMFGIDGKRRLTEVTLPWLEGYRGSRPVRVGNLASEQRQLDMYAELMELAWIRRRHGEQADPDYWEFFVEVVDEVCRQWSEPDHGIWEERSAPRHFVYSKAMCWAAVKRGLDLAEACGNPAPLERWRHMCTIIRADIEEHGYDHRRGTFVQAYGSDYLDAALLLLPRFEFIDYKDPRMIRTVDAICQDLSQQGLIARYNSPDGLIGPEGTFLPCTFWLVSCLAQQGRFDLARNYYNRALACANDVQLFAEEYDPIGGEMLGNFPQVLTHVSQIRAKLALTTESHLSN